MAAPKARYRCPVEDQLFTTWGAFKQHIDRIHPPRDQPPLYEPAQPVPPPSASAPEEPVVLPTSDSEFRLEKVLRTLKVLDEHRKFIIEYYRGNPAVHNPGALFSLLMTVRGIGPEMANITVAYVFGILGAQSAPPPPSPPDMEQKKHRFRQEVYEFVKEEFGGEFVQEMREVIKKALRETGEEEFAFMERMKAEMASSAPPSVSKPALSNLQRPAKCRTCGQEFPTGQALGVHVQIVHPVPQKCRQCGNILPNVPSLMRHVHDKHPRPRRENPEPHRIAKVEYPPGRARGLEALFPPEGG